MVVVLRIAALQESKMSSLEAQSNPTQQPLRRTMTIVTLAWLSGSVWITATQGAPLTLFAKSLNASEFQFGVLAALPFLLSLLSVPASLLVEHTGQRKRIFLSGLYLNRATWFIIALVPVWMIGAGGAAQSSHAMILFLCLMALMHSGQAVGGTAWVSWMADVIPDRLRSRYFAGRRQLGLLSAIPAAIIAGYVLDHRASPAIDLMTLKYCAGIFIVAAVFGLIDIHCFHYVDEPLRPRDETRRTFSALTAPLRDRNFLIFAAFVGTMIFSISFTSQFLTLYLLEKVHISNTRVQLMLLVAPMLLQLLFIPVWGAASDRVGKKPLLAVASLTMIPLGLGWVLVSGSNPWLGYSLAAAGAAAWAGVEIVNFNFVMEMAQRGGAGYVAVNSVIVNIAGCLGGLSAGLFAQRFRDFAWTPWQGSKTLSYYDLLFILSGAIRLGAVLFLLPLLHEPTARSWHVAVRYMSSNIYETLITTLDQPLRLLPARKAAVAMDEVA